MAADADGSLVPVRQTRHRRRLRGNPLLRVLRTEVVRGLAIPMGVLVTVALACDIYVVGGTGWGGAWNSLGVSIRHALVLAGPVVVAGAVVTAQRERRRGMGELLASTPRRPWHRVVMAWAAPVVVAMATTLLVWGSGAVIVARVATDHHDWFWQLLVALVAVVATAAVGTLIGRVVPWRVTAPVVAVVLYYLYSLGASGQINDGRLWLSPALPPWMDSTALNLNADGAMLEMLWFAAVAAAALVVSAARRRLWVGLPLLIAAAVAPVLVDGSGQDRWPLAPAALREVCAGDAPTICLSQRDAYLMDSLRQSVDTVWPVLAGHDDAPAVVRIDTGTGRAPGADTAAIYTFGNDLQGRLLHPGAVEANLVSAAVEMRCEVTEGSSDADAWFEVYGPATTAAAGVVNGGPLASPAPTTSQDDSAAEHLEQVLAAMSSDQRAEWLDRYLNVVRATGPCDLTALRAVVEAP